MPMPIRQTTTRKACGSSLVILVAGNTSQLLNSPPAINDVRLPCGKSGVITGEI